MARSGHHLNRRQLMASLTALPALGHPALAFAARFEDQYRHAIAQAEMPRPDMKLTVLDFTAGTEAGETTLTAIVEMELAIAQATINMNARLPETEDRGKRRNSRFCSV